LVSFALVKAPRRPAKGWHNQSEIHLCKLFI